MRKTISVLITTAALALSSTIAAFAENPLPKSTDKLVKYGEVEGWTIYDNETRGHCLIVSNDENGAVQMGVTEDSVAVGYLGVFTHHDIGLKDGTKSKIFVSIDGNIYSGVSTSVSSHLKDGYSGGYILTDNPEFKRDIAKKYKMIVFPETAGALVVDLKGTYKAMAMARECFLK